MKKFTVNVTTAADGTATAYTPRFRGKVHSIAYIKAGSGNFDDGVDFAITGEDTGEGLWTESNVNASKQVYPRADTHGRTAGASLFAAGGTAVQDKVGIVGRVKIVIAQGGNAKTGQFLVMVE